jgi:hypothetical protein
MTKMIRATFCELINENYRNHLKGMGFQFIFDDRIEDKTLNIELKEEIETINQIFESEFYCLGKPIEINNGSNINVQNISDKGISLWFFLGESGDATVFIPYTNISCISSYCIGRDKKEPRKSNIVNFNRNKDLYK